MERILYENEPISFSREKAHPLTNVSALCAFGILCAFLGWVIENVACLLSNSFIDSRFHLMPLIPEYALIPVALYLLFGDVNDLSFFGHKLFKDDFKHKKLWSNLICLLVLFLGVYLGEEITGNLVEMTSGAVLWNYEELPMAFSKYTCFYSVFGFGLGAYLLFKYVYPPLLRFFTWASKSKAFRAFSITVAILMFFDASWMILQTLIHGEAPIYWRISFA